MKQTELDQLHLSQLEGDGYFEMANPDLAKKYQEAYEILLSEKIYLINHYGKYGVGQILFTKKAASRVRDMLTNQRNKALKLVEAADAALEEFIYLVFLMSKGDQ